MLKACWDCIGGYDLIGDQNRRGEDPHIQLNGTGGTQGSPWQSLGHANMFPTPVLSAGNQIIIKGQMTNDRRLNMALSTSYKTECEIKVVNRPNDNEDYIEIISHGNVVHHSEANASFNDGKIRTGTQYIFRFEVNGDGTEFDIFVGTEEDGSDQLLESVSADINNIKMISADGQVEKLTFVFK